MSTQAQQKTSQNPNQSQSSQSPQGSRPDASQSWDKNASAKSQTGMKNEPTSQSRDQSRLDTAKK